GPSRKAAPKAKQGQRWWDHTEQPANLGAGRATARTRRGSRDGAPRKRGSVRAPVLAASCGARGALPRAWGA
ncbi:unnamed protein product, partial [Prorocentrum cordatum]